MEKFERKEIKNKEFNSRERERVETFEVKSERSPIKKKFFNKEETKDFFKNLALKNKKQAVYALAAFLSFAPISCSTEKDSSQRFEKDVVENDIECNKDFNTIERFNEYKEKKNVVAFPENMVGRKIGGLFKDYLGLDGDTIPSSANLDYFDSSLKLWKKKLNREHTPATRDNVGKILQTYYENKDFSTLKEFSKEISKNIDIVNKNLDKEEMFKHFKFTEKEEKIFNSINSLISDENILAYGMTELMPSNDGKFNKEVLSFLLENAGKNYLHSIPALHDKYCSFGLYQFTSFAVKAGSEEKGGASVVNDFLKKEKIPGSVALLKEDDHHKAAYLFSIYNLSRVIKQGGDKEFEKLLAIKDFHERKQAITIYMATAHHLPAPARTLFLKWLGSNDLSVKNYINILNQKNEALKLYAIKTSNNLSALNDNYKMFNSKDFAKAKTASKNNKKTVLAKKKK